MLVFNDLIKTVRKGSTGGLLWTDCSTGSMISALLKGETKEELTGIHKLFTDTQFLIAQPGEIIGDVYRSQEN